MSPTRLYRYIITIALLGLAWIGAKFWIFPHGTERSICLVKNISGFPCPSCGTTRAISSLVKGDFISSVLINPLGIVVAVIILVVPVWIVFDLTTGKTSFHKTYQSIEAVLRRKIIAFPLIFFVIVNWIWNISKGI